MDNIILIFIAPLSPFSASPSSTPNPSGSDRDLFTVEFDDGDTGRIPLDHIRIIPQDFPHVGQLAYWRFADAT